MCPSDPNANTNPSESLAKSNHVGSMGPHDCTNNLAPAAGSKGLCYALWMRSIAQVTKGWTRRMKSSGATAAR